MNNVYILAFAGPQQIILVLILVLLLFGGKKIPELMKGLGKGIKEFKSATDDDVSTKSDVSEKKD